MDAPPRWAPVRQRAHRRSLRARRRLVVVVCLFISGGTWLGAHLWFFGFQRGETAGSRSQLGFPA